MMDFWNQTFHFNSVANKPPLLIHVVSYQRPQALVCLLSSLACQVSQNFEVCVTHDEFHAPTLDVIKTFTSMCGLPVTLKFTTHRMGLWGHPMRAQVLTECDHEYLLLTNDDNYYVPLFTNHMMNTIRSHDAHMVMCDMIHSHNMPGGRPQPPYNLFVTEPSLMNCDIGCFITKTTQAQRVGFSDCDQSSADGLFVNKLMQLNDPPIKVIKVPQVLFVHN